MLRTLVFPCWFVLLSVLLYKRAQPQTPRILWTPTPSIQPQIQIPPVVDAFQSSHRWGGVDYCVHIENLTLPALPRVRLDRGSTLCPGIDAVGSVYFRGPAVLEDTLFVGGQNINHLVAQIRALNNPSCGPCFRGIRLFPDCKCMCQPGFTGTHCNVTSTPPPLSPSTNQKSQRPCTTKYINNTACPTRVNWGRDEDYICGGGYEYGSTTAISISHLDCNGTIDCHQIWMNEAAICCAPGITCSKPSCETHACCVVRNTKPSCLDGGCAWCDGYCALQADALHCTLPYTLSTLEGDWRTTVSECATDNGLNTVCDEATRQQYLDIYSVEQPLTHLGLLRARAKVNEQQWPRLAVPDSFDPGVARWLARAGNYPLDNSCRAYLGRSHVSVAGSLAVWSCRPEAIYLVNMVVWNAHGECLDWSPSPLWWQTAVQLLGGDLQNFTAMVWRHRGQCEPVTSLALQSDPLGYVYPGLANGTSYLSAAGVPIPLIPDQCDLCNTLGNCTVKDRLCLKVYWHALPWQECCGCLWKHTDYRLAC